MIFILASIMQTLLLIMRVFDAITWSWWIVFSPSLFCAVVLGFVFWGFRDYHG